MKNMKKFGWVAPVVALCLAPGGERRAAAAAVGLFGVNGVVAADQEGSNNQVNLFEPGQTSLTLATSSVGAAANFVITIPSVDNISASASGTAPFTSGTAITEYWDTLTFSGATAGATGTLSFAVSGAFSSASSSLASGSACFGTEVDVTSSPLGLACTPGQAGAQTLFGVSPGAVIFAEIPLDAGPVFYTAGLELSVNPETDGTLVTGTLDPGVTLVLPAGVTVSSASGVAYGPVSSPSPVPEPRTWLPMAGAILFAALGLRLRGTADHAPRTRPREEARRERSSER